jgi:hypothetical protein
MINRMRTPVSRLYRRHFVARPAGPELRSNLLVNSHLELELVQPTARQELQAPERRTLARIFRDFMRGFLKGSGERVHDH